MTKTITEVGLEEQSYRVEKHRKVAIRLNMNECCVPMSEFEVDHLIREGVKAGYEVYEVCNTIYWFVREGHKELGYSRGVRLRDVLERITLKMKEEEAGKPEAEKPKKAGKAITVRAHDERLQDGRIIHHKEYTYYR